MRALKNLALLLASGLACACLLEAATRLYFHMPLLTLRDWRVMQATVLANGAVRYDPLLGWTQSAGVVSSGFNTIKYGIRKNSSYRENLVTGGILAVGDSFTAGSEVADAESWPAQLERQLGVRVLNAGVGGYGPDQIVLNAERLLAELRPKVVIIGLLTQAVLRANYSVFSAPKPYFVKDGNGRWTLMNDPVPRDYERPKEPLFKTLLAHSFVAHLIFQRHRFYDWWFSSGAGAQFQHVENVPEDVTCYLLDRLKKELDAAGARGVVVSQYGGWTYARGEDRPTYMQSIAACARRDGYLVVDEYDSLAQIAQESVERLKEYYVMSAGGTSYGHMSAKGNALIAELLANTIRSNLDLGALTKLPLHPEVSEEQPGTNLIAAGALDRAFTANAVLGPAPRIGVLKDEPVYRLRPTDADGEHYIVLPWLGRAPGQRTFSVYVHQSPGNALRLQLLDERKDVAIADFTDNLVKTVAVGNASALHATATEAPGGWRRLAISANLPSESGSIIIQLMQPQPGTAFSGTVPDALLQAPMVEFGPSASPVIQGHESEAR
jgi:lysophospholipase L1-like esterase